MYNFGKKNIWKMTITQSHDDFDSERTKKEEMKKTRMRYESIERCGWSSSTYLVVVILLLVLHLLLLLQGRGHSL